MFWTKKKPDQDELLKFVDNEGEPHFIKRSAIFSVNVNGLRIWLGTRNGQIWLDASEKPGDIFDRINGNHD